MAGKVCSITSYSAATMRATVDVFGQPLTGVLNTTGEILQPGYVVWVEQRGEALHADWVVTGIYSPAVRKIGCKLRRAANQSIASGAATSISWDTEDEDPQNFITTPGTTIFIPAGLGGLYAITAWAVAGAALAGRCFIDIQATTADANFPPNLRATANAAENRYLNTVVVPLDDTALFVVQLFHTAGVAVNHTAWLSCYRIGDA